MRVTNQLDSPLILIRGAGELGSAVAVILKRVGYSVVLTELASPLAIRRSVTFSDAMFTGSASVEGITAKKVESIDDAFTLPFDYIPIIDDSEIQLNNYYYQIDFTVDARMLKKKTVKPGDRYGTIIGLGPGFSVGKNCNMAIETKRGHNLGRIIHAGSTSENTGIPGHIGGENRRRVIYSDSVGKVIWDVSFGDIVNEGSIIGYMNDKPVQTRITGKVRGLISPNVTVGKGTKIADIDPRGNEITHTLISDKANAIARAVLEIIVIKNDRYPLMFPD